VKILLADDDPVACSILSMLLEAQGHEVIEASDGELAWQLVQQGEINFVVSDWLMPNLAGVDLCRRIRAAEFDRYVYVILCTSKGEKSDLIEGLDAGADDFLVKPISPEELRVKVRAGERVLSLQQGLAEKNRELAGINSQLQTAHRLVQDDLKAAAWMQQRLLPQPAHQLQDAMNCEWRLEPSGYIAGDIFNIFPMNEREIAFYLLDVCGHGVPAAMLSVTLSMLLTPDASKGSPLKLINPDNGRAETLSPDDAVRELNRRFQSLDDRYFTMIYGLFNQQTKTMRIAQAGHPGPILLRKGEAAQILGEGGMPVGLWPQIEFDSFELSVQPGDRIVLYSDGVTECNNAHGEAFGETRLLDCLQKGAALSLKDSLDALLHKIKSWRNAADFSDDISLLAFEITASETSPETPHLTFPGERYEIRRSHGRRSTDRKAD
jgi:sigma-B regulation protein RsbU (phosphoserine phosphatase)